MEKIRRDTANSRKHKQHAPKILNVLGSMTGDAMVVSICAKVPREKARDHAHGGKVRLFIFCIDTI